jgi:predicted transposase YbfD/YdcC
MPHEEKAVIAQHRIPNDTTETTQVRALLEHVDLENAVVTADAVNAQQETAKYIASKKEDGGRGSTYFLFVKGNQPRLQRAVFDAVQAAAPRPRLHRTGQGDGRIIRRSIWVSSAEDIGIPHVRQVARIRRDGYDADGQLISKELARGQWGIESVHWLRDTAWREDENTGYAGNCPRGHCHAAESRRQPALSLRRHRDHPHPPGHQP